MERHPESVSDIGEPTEFFRPIISVSICVHLWFSICTAPASSRTRTGRRPGADRPKSKCILRALCDLRRLIAMTQPLVKLDDVDAALDGRLILQGIQWQLMPGEHWAILGGNGSGKSTFLKLIRGDLWPAPGRGQRSYVFDGEEQTSAVGVREKIALVSPELQERYLQQEWTLTAWQVIQTGFFASDYLYERPGAQRVQFAKRIIRLLGIERLVTRNVQQLSTGELRKVLIARALVGAPRVLILDEVCDGLDAPSRAHCLKNIERIAHAGTQVLYTTHRSEEIIPSISHALLLEAGKIAWQGLKKKMPEIIDGAEPGRHLPCLQTTTAGNTKPKVRPPGLLISIRGADVFLNRKKVLRGIDWQMRADQNWAVFGRNGAGKSTFARLVFGDLHAAAGARVQRFNLNARDSIWDIKKRISYISPDFQANYRERLTGEQVVVSGFFSSIGLITNPTRRQMQSVRKLIHQFGCLALAKKKIFAMSYGEFRKILLLRSLVNQPRILICDEPFDGLDQPSRAEFRRALEQVSENGARLIVVTHHLDDLPACITHALRMSEGRIQRQGELSTVRVREEESRRADRFRASAAR